jgi:hypothetical protein
MLSTEEKARRIQALSVSERVAEEMRQTQELAGMIEALIHTHGQATELPILNSVFAALLSVEAHMLATLEPEHRRAMIKASDRARPAYLANALTGHPGRATAIKVRRFEA